MDAPLTNIGMYKNQLSISDLFGIEFLLFISYLVIYIVIIVKYMQIAINVYFYYIISDEMYDFKYNIEFYILVITPQIATNKIIHRNRTTQTLDCTLISTNFCFQLCSIDCLTARCDLLRKLNLDPGSVLIKALLVDFFVWDIFILPTYIECQSCLTLVAAATPVKYGSDIISAVFFYYSKEQKITARMRLI